MNLHSLSRELIAQGKLIEAGFCLRILAVDPDVSPDHSEALRNAFFAGAHCLFSTLIAVLDPTTPEPTPVDLKEDGGDRSRAIRLHPGFCDPAIADQGERVMGQPAMTVITLMAAALDAELQARGIFALRKSDCEAIMTAVLERTAAAASEKTPREPART